MRLKKRRSSAVAVLTTVALVTAWPGAWTGASAAAPSTAKDQSTARSRPAHVVRSIYTHEFGVNRPTGLAWDTERKVFMVTGRGGKGGTPISSFTAFEQGRGRRVLDITSDEGTAAFDPRSDRVTVLRDGRRFTVASGETVLARWARAATSDALTRIEPAGTTYGPDGTMYVLDASSDDIVSVTSSGTVETTSLQDLDGIELRGLAYQPGTGNLFVADASANTLYAVDQTGEVVGERNLADSAISTVESMTFAPSGDGTDPASEQSLYIADSGTAEALGAVTEVSLTAAASTVTSGYTVSPSTTERYTTSTWSPPSPDPSGITYIPESGLLVSDGEVEEMAIYDSTNLWMANTDGTQIDGKTGTTHPRFSDEPVGLEYKPDGHLLVADDTAPTSVYELSGPGDDGMFGTADDPAPTSFATGKYGNTDPEGVGYDSKRDHVLVVDGLNLELFRYTPSGTLLSQTDLQALGMDDPEGITYDVMRDTVVVLDHVGIWELDENGSLLGRISTAGTAIDKPAGVTIAPASDGSGARNYFVVDRGKDNDSNPLENDGALFEIGGNLPDVSNRPPVVDAGKDIAVDLGQPVQLSGTATDTENDPLTYAWSKASGPGTVTFGSPTELTTSATFSGGGTYTLRLTVKDSRSTVYDEVVVSVYQGGAVREITIPIAVGSDDAREGTANSPLVSVAALSRAHNRLGSDISDPNDPSSARYAVTTGLRFADIPVPQGGQVVSAKIQFETQAVFQGDSSLAIQGEASDSAATYQAVRGSITSRPYLPDSVGWAPPVWDAVGEAGVDQLTPELSAIVQKIVDRQGWAAGNAVAFKITGTGIRSAQSFEGRQPGAPKLVLQYRTSKPVNQAPVVTATADQTTVKLPATATLTGTAADDDLPEPASLTTSWSKVSGEGAVSFGSPSALTTTASFSGAGTYVLRLTADDGQLTGHADVSVTVQAADVVSTPTPTPTPGGTGGGGGGGTPTPTPTPTPDPGSETPEDATVTLQSQLSAVQYDGVVRLSGVVAEGGFASEDTTVRVFVRRAPDWRTRELGSAETDGQGTFTVEDRPTVTSRYYAMVGDASSGIVQVLVRPRLSAAVTNAAVLVGTRTSIVGQVAPTVKGHLLRLQRWNGKGWQTVASKSLARAAQARYRFAVVPKASGLSRYRVVSPAQGGRARTVSPGKAGLVVKAYDAAVKRVNARGDVVVVSNTGTVALSLAGWWLLETRTGARVGLPDFVVRPGASVRIHSRSGTSDRRNLYLGTGEMWGVHGVAELRDARLRLADRLRY